MKKVVCGWTINDWGDFRPQCECPNADIILETVYGDPTTCEVSWNDVVDRGRVVNKRIPMEVLAEFLRHHGYEVTK